MSRFTPSAEEIKRMDERIISFSSRNNTSQRIGQLIFNAFKGEDIFYVEDEEFERVVEKYIEKLARRGKEGKKWGKVKS